MKYNKELRAQLDKMIEESKDFWNPFSMVEQFAALLAEIDRLEARVAQLEEAVDYEQ